MQKALYLLLAVLVVGCTNHEEQDLATELGIPRQLHASYEQMTTRTVVEDGLHTNWCAGDKISYFHRMNSNLQYQLQGAPNSQEEYSLFQRRTSSIKKGSALTYCYAVYPYSNDITIDSEGDISVEIPEVQHYAENSYGAGAAPMVAISNGGEDEVLQFKNAAGFLKLQLYGSNLVVKRVELSGNASEKLAGEATIIVKPNSNPKIVMSDLSTDKVVLDCGKGVQISGDSAQPTAFWFALPEMLFIEGFTVTVYDADGTPYAMSTSDSYIISRNTIQSIEAMDVREGANINVGVDKESTILYISERSGGLRSGTTIGENNWSDYSVLLNGEKYGVNVDNRNKPYIQVKRNENDEYKAVLVNAESKKWYASTPYESLVLPCSQFDFNSAAAIHSFPMYATYNKEDGRNLIFNDGFALLRLRLSGVGNITSVRVESPSKYTLAGVTAQVADNGTVSVDNGTNFVALNCINKGRFAALNSSEKRDFYLMVAPGDYSDGLRISVCDNIHRAAFYDIANLKLAAGDIYTLDKEYQPNESLVFYEGFDNCVWGGDIMRGSAGVGFAPDNSNVSWNNCLDRDGYAEALTMVPYNTAGTAFIQSNDYNDVNGRDVATSHQVSDSYIESRNFGEEKYLYRVQEYPGYIAVGAGNTGRGMYTSPIISNVKGIGTLKVKIRFAMQAGFNGIFETIIERGARVTAAKLDGKDLTLDSSNFSHKVSAILSLDKSQLIVPQSAAAAKVWQTLELELSDAANGVRVLLRDQLTASGVHGIYVDCIEVVQVDEWKRDDSTLRVILWNIQNGMWADQHKNYDNFVEWVKKWNADVCIWCESESIYVDMTDYTSSNKYLPDGWNELCQRYGHSYAAVGGNRDNYPQTITSKYPITTVRKITNTNKGGKPVSHGAGHFSIEVNGKTINIVTLHMWPMAYSFEAKSDEDREVSAANKGGDLYREHEMQYIVDNTINNTNFASEEYWILAGDTNSSSSLDNWYLGLGNGSTSYYVHNILLNQTKMKDVIGHRYPNCFFSSTMGSARIDMMYASPSLYNAIRNSTTLVDKWLAECKPSVYVSAFYDRSDHLPIIVDFDLSK